ncbi:unnamed protein product [Mytilus edulis]|uniref:UspA domain-containing protein n=1 Tax=Mytilus edulis TaxID=6550 RepID=A0A8S3UK63_MYTED|nr:unnamed protein product [Mytilus edulis]
MQSNFVRNCIFVFVKNVYHEGLDVVLMHCVHHRAQNTYGSVWMPVEPHLVVHAYHEERKKGEEVCKKLKAKLDTYKIGGQVIQLDGGDPGHTIVQKCEELRASVIVVGSRGLGAIRRTLIGSAKVLKMVTDDRATHFKKASKDHFKHDLRYFNGYCLHGNATLWYSINEGADRMKETGRQGWGKGEKGREKGEKGPEKGEKG